MTYRYLTHSYVEAMGLQFRPFKQPRNTGVRCFFNENGVLPRAEGTYFVGVELDGHIYKREPGGLSYVCVG